MTVICTPDISETITIRKKREIRMVMVVVFPNRRRAVERVYFCEQKLLTVNSSVWDASATVRLCCYRSKFSPMLKV
jgi:hypothetical protein